MTRALIVSVAALLLAGAQSEDSITGKWQGTTAAGSEIVLDLSATGTVLTGTLTRNGETVKISEGKVSKNKLSFKAAPNDQVEGFTGELVGGELKIWLDRRGPESTTIFKRVKK